MKIASFDGGRVGLVRGDEIVDVSEVVGADPRAWPPVAMPRLIRDIQVLRPKLEAADGPAKPLGEVRLEAPITWPNKLLAYPVNYSEHGKEMSSSNRADLNGFFLKANSSIVGPQDSIVVPDLEGREVHHECELGLVIGGGGRNIAREEAMSHVFGYFCLVDVTVRGSEERVMRKSHDTFTPTGPWITTADEVENPHDLHMKLWVNDELRQDASTRDLILDIPGMIAMASAAATLMPGDIIATGTPAGVGPIRRGDRVRIALEGLGEMTLPVE